MKILDKIAICFLKQRKISIVIGYEITNGNLKSIYNNSYIYKNILNNVEFKNNDNNKFSVPEGKFECYYEGIMIENTNSNVIKDNIIK